MPTQSLRVVVVLAVAIVTALAGADRASAAGAVAIDSCRTLTDTNTTYKLITDLTSCGDCLFVANNKITIDLQGHSITGTCPGSGGAITDAATTFDLITVKNGSLSGFGYGVFLQSSTRVSVLGVTVTGNTQRGIVVGPQGLVKGSEASGNKVGIEVGPRGQVQQCNTHHNVFAGISVSGDNCLITMNTASSNDEFGIITEGDKCTISYNTANDNGLNRGIDAGASFGGTGHLVTGNVAMNNGDGDFGINCPSTVTNNQSTSPGFPASYAIFGTGCHFTNND